VLLLFGIGTFSGWIKNILITALVIIIGAVVTMILFFVLDEIIDANRLLSTLENPLVFTDIALAIGSMILVTILYNMTTKAGWMSSIFRSVISVIIATVLLILSQQLFDMSGILWSVVLFHVFLAIMLFLTGIRSADSKLIHLAHTGRVSFLHFVIMFVIFVILRIFLV